MSTAASNNAVPQILHILIWEGHSQIMLSGAKHKMLKENMDAISSALISCLPWADK
jgi:hypothetical protein